MDDKEKQAAADVIEILGTSGMSIIRKDIAEQIEYWRNELETFKVERDNDDFVKGEIAGLRWLSALIDKYRADYESAK